LIELIYDGVMLKSTASHMEHKKENTILKKKNISSNVIRLVRIGAKLKTMLAMFDY